MYRIFGPQDNPHSGTFGAVFEALRLPPVVGSGNPIVHERFIISMAPALWNAAEELNIDALGLIAQSGIETNWGRFVKSDGVTPGAVQDQFYNTAGIKVRHQSMEFPDQLDQQPLLADKPLAHQMFASWPQGARAQAQHIYVWAGGELLLQDIVDPRWWIVRDLLLRGTYQPIQQWSDLGGGRWAPGTLYGRNIERIMDRLRKGANQ